MPWLKILYRNSPESRCMKSTPADLSQCPAPISLRFKFLSRKRGSNRMFTKLLAASLNVHCTFFLKLPLFPLFESSVNCPSPHWFSLLITCKLSTNLDCKRCRSPLHFERWARRNPKMISFIYRAPKLQPNILLMTAQPVDCETGH